jgi:hypothetical protein
MTRLILIAMLLLAGCADAQQEEPAEEAEYAPIGPGSDSSALLPPDTPQSQRNPAPAQPAQPRDTTP